MELVLIVLGVVILVCFSRGAKALLDHARGKAADRGGWWLLTAGVLAILAFGMDALEQFATTGGQKEFESEIQTEVGPPSHTPSYELPGVSRLHSEVDRHTEQALNPYGD